jgi:hypothetical protein
MSYHDLRSRIAALRRSRPDGSRDVEWIDGSRRLGVSRDSAGAIEIFITGPQLDAKSTAIRRNLAFGNWLRQDDLVLPANRLLLPSASHFDGVATFICNELIEHRVLDDAQLALELSEPVIELAIERMEAGDASLVGLVGELVLMLGLFDAIGGAGVSLVLEAWHGFQRSSRDFQLPEVGVEVKTTRGPNSRHRIQGVRQVEVGHGVSGAPESALYLVSIGLAPVESVDEAPGSHSLGELVDRVVATTRMLDTDARDRSVSRFLTHVSTYLDAGGDTSDIDQMRSWPGFNRRWQVMFVRAYDMSDDAILTLRTADLAPFTMVDPASVRFMIDLPGKVDGDVNPVAGLEGVCRRLVERAWPAVDGSRT